MHFAFRWRRFLFFFAITLLSFLCFFVGSNSSAMADSVAIVKFNRFQNRCLIDDLMGFVDIYYLFFINLISFLSALDMIFSDILFLYFFILLIDFILSVGVLEVLARRAGPPFDSPRLFFGVRGLGGAGRGCLKRGCLNEAWGVSLRAKQRVCAAHSKK